MFEVSVRKGAGRTGSTLRAGRLWDRHAMRGGAGARSRHSGARRHNPPRPGFWDRVGLCRLTAGYRYKILEAIPRVRLGMSRRSHSFQGGRPTRRPRRLASRDRISETRASRAGGHASNRFQSFRTAGLFRRFPGVAVFPRGANSSSRMEHSTRPGSVGLVLYWVHHVADATCRPGRANIRTF
jgi:hypothetical protein